MIMKIVGWVIKNLALLIGIVESILKLAAGIVSLTPTKKDDKICAKVDKTFSAIKKVLYTISDKLNGNEPTVPNS